MRGWAGLGGLHDSYNVCFPAFSVREHRVCGRWPVELPRYGNRK